MATEDSRERRARRRMQRWLEWVYTLPEVRSFLREARRKRKRRRWPGASADSIRAHCALEGWRKGGRPPTHRHCTKRLRSRRGWNWQVAGTDRCHRHQRAAIVR
jgi:hypothetical protein